MMYVFIRYITFFWNLKFFCNFLFNKRFVHFWSINNCNNAMSSQLTNLSKIEGIGVNLTTFCLLCDVNGLLREWKDEFKLFTLSLFVYLLHFIVSVECKYVNRKLKSFSGIYLSKWIWTWLWWHGLIVTFMFHAVLLLHV